MLFLGGLRDADELLAEFDAVGLGVEDILIFASSCDISAILISGEPVDIVSRNASNMASMFQVQVVSSPSCKLLQCSYRKNGQLFGGVCVVSRLDKVWDRYNKSTESKKG